jgi:hypothetical protein
MQRVGILSFSGQDSRWLAYAIRGTALHCAAHACAVPQGVSGQLSSTAVLPTHRDIDISTSDGDDQGRVLPPGGKR